MSAGRDLLPAPFSEHLLLEAWEGGEGRACRIESPDGVAQLLKILHPGEESVETDLLLSLSHPRIPKLLQQGTLESGEPYLLRQWLPGRSLTDCLPLEDAAVLDMGIQILEILGYVHLRGLLHLDLKPANLLRDGEGRYHLLDFGLGERKGARSRSGTPFFAAPEQWSGRTVDRRSDLYSLGLVLLVALDPGILRRMPGGCPEGWDLQDLLETLRFEQSLSDGLRALLRGLVARHPQQRFYDAEEALAHLGQGTGRPSPSLLEPDPALFGAVHVMGHEDLCEHLVQALELPPAEAASLALRIAVDGETGTAQVGHWLMARVAEGSILPRGGSWSYPDALSGRVSKVTPCVLVTSPEELRELAASGRVLAAEHGFRHLLQEGQAEPETRMALAEGWLQAGEAARALPLLHDQPWLRLRALLDLGRVREASEGLLSLSREAGTQVGRIRLEATIAWLSGRSEEALALAHRAAQEEGGPEAEIVWARILAETGDAKRARSLLEAALTTLRSERRPYLLAGALSNLGELLRKEGEREEALSCQKEALALYQALGHARYCALVHSNMGVALKDASRHGEALEAQRRARGLYEHVGDARGAAIALANQGILHLELEQPDVALGKLEEARESLSHLGADNLDTRLQLEIARACLARGELDRTEAMLLNLEVDPGLVNLRNSIHAACAGARADETTSESATSVDEKGREPNVDTESAGRTSSEHSGVPHEVFRSFVAINRKLANETDLDRAMHALLDTALTLSGARQGYLLLSGPTGIRTELRIGQGPGSKAYSRSIANRAIQEQRILEGGEALADRDLLHMPSVQRLEQRSVLCVPFHCSSGQTGALYVEHPGRAGVFGESEKEHLEVLADQAAIAVERMQREERLAEDLSKSRRDLDVARQALGSRRPRRELLGSSSEMESLRREIERLAPSSLPVLIQGETGTGKELVAEALHRESRRSQGPFVSQNCAAIPTELAESLLFGHVKGAFTGADEDRPGLLELASGGTLFLDEIGDLPLLLQAKLLRALQEGVVRRVGGEQEHGLDLRLLAATHRDLEEDRREGRFREDLYYRIAAATLRIPPLRARGEDALFLADHFLQKLCQREGTTVRLAQSAEEEIQTHAWPGNVRELEYAIARAFLMNEAGVIPSMGLQRARQSEVEPGVEPGDDPRGERGNQREGEARELSWPVTSLKEVESRTILAVLAHTGGDKTRAAKILCISRTALYEKLKRMNAEPGQG